MDLNFLEEYEKKEIGAFEKQKNVSERIGRLKSPIFHITGPCSSIWSQIAFSGTVIFPLHPLPQFFFEKGWNLSINEFPDLIQFVKETKKIQFVLTALPTKYEECDYLEPILKELAPPVYTQIGGDDEKLQNLTLKCNAEIKSLIPISSEWTFLSLSNGGQHIIEDYIHSYTLLRYLGFNDIADTFIDNFLADPKYSKNYIITAYDLLVDPIIDPFKANPSFCMEKIQNASKMGITDQLSLKNPTLPEVGSYLIKKCTHYPESLNACKNLIDRYEENDLYRVNAALNNAIGDRNDQSIIRRKNEIGEILDNVWDDKTIKNNSTLFNYGINITCGTIGYCLGGGIPGLLASIGMRVIDSKKSNYIDNFAELISKRIASPYLATIYDFKKKYRKDA